MISSITDPVVVYKPAPDDTLFVAILCPTWHHTVLRSVADGVEIKCKSCRGAIQHISK
jgi:hypothetical protein